MEILAALAYKNWAEVTGRDCDCVDFMALFAVLVRIAVPKCGSPRHCQNDPATVIEPGDGVDQ